MASLKNSSVNTLQAVDELSQPLDPSRLLVELREKYLRMVHDFISRSWLLFYVWFNSIKCCFHSSALDFKSCVEAWEVCSDTVLLKMSSHIQFLFQSEYLIVLINDTIVLNFVQTLYFFVGREWIQTWNICLINCGFDNISLAVKITFLR